jgi:apolipoprotein N-acyltransferase
VVKLISDSGCYFVIGAPHYENDKSYNSAFAFGPDGKVLCRYDKQRPVPFGEYLPMRAIFYPLLSGQSDLFENWYSPNPYPKLLDLKFTKLGVVICFESTFPNLVLARARSGADVIVVLTNDAWFASSSLLFQHLDNGVFRAVETGLPLVQVGNTGFSAVIDPAGRVLKKTGIMREVALSLKVPQKMPPTFYAKFGDWFVYVIALMVLVSIFLKKLSVRGPV